MSNVIRTYTEAIIDAKAAFDGIEDCNVNYDREKYFAIQICERNTALQNINILPSLAHAVRNVALCGITLNPAMKLAYIVPRKGMACLDISYMGLIKIATDSGSVSHVNCQLVYANDEFELIQGTSESLTHKPVSFGDRGELIGVYTIATIHNGEKIIETMSRAEVEKVRERSKAKSGPWLTDYEEMTRKTCVKRASKYWPKTERLAEAVETLNEHEGFEPISSPGTEAAEKAQNQEVEEKDIDRRLELVEYLKEIANESGIEGYAKVWKGLKPEERKLVGSSEHENLKASCVTEAEVVEDD